MRAPHRWLSEERVGDGHGEVQSDVGFTLFVSLVKAAIVKHCYATVHFYGIKAKRKSLTLDDDDDGSVTVNQRFNRGRRAGSGMMRTA